METQAITSQPIELMLSKIQRELKAPKGQFNKFGNFRYRSCEDILEAVKAHLEEGCIVNLYDEIQMVGDRIYVKATASFCYQGEQISSSAFAREPVEKKGMDQPQVTGTASSYARKYALNGLFAIDDNKDPDTNEYQAHENKPQGKPVTAAPSPSNVADYVVPVGTNKGKKLKDIPKPKLESWTKYMKGIKDLKGPGKEALDAVEKYLNQTS